MAACLTLTKNSHSLTVFQRPDFKMFYRAPNCLEPKLISDLLLLCQPSMPLRSCGTRLFTSPKSELNTTRKKVVFFPSAAEIKAAVMRLSSCSFSRDRIFIYSPFLQLFMTLQYFYSSTDISIRDNQYIVAAVTVFACFTVAAVPITMFIHASLCKIRECVKLNKWS